LYSGGFKTDKFNIPENGMNLVRRRNKINVRTGKRNNILAVIICRAIDVFSAGSNMKISAVLFMGLLQLWDFSCISTYLFFTLVFINNENRTIF